MPDTMRERVAGVLASLSNGSRTQVEALDAIFAEERLYMDDLRRDLKAERTRSAELSVKVHGYTQTIDDLMQERHEWQAREAKLVEALEKYGQHMGDCNADLSDGDDIYHCTCGLDAALAVKEEHHE